MASFSLSFYEKKRQITESYTLEETMNRMTSGAMIKQSGLSESFPHAIHDQILLEDVSVVPQEL